MENSMHMFPRESEHLQIISYVLLPPLFNLSSQEVGHGIKISPPSINKTKFL